MIVLIRLTPVAAAENTNSKRVSGVTDTDNPVVRPLLIVPIARLPFSVGVNVTNALGIAVKALFGVVDSYN